MEITFITSRKLSPQREAKLTSAFGFEITLDCEDDGDFEYYFGYSQDAIEDGGEDPLPYEEAVRCCGVLWKNLCREFCIEGNGPWAMEMIRRTDFSGFAFSHAHRVEWERIATIFWTAVGSRARLRELRTTSAKSEVPR